LLKGSGQTARRPDLQPFLAGGLARDQLYLTFAYIENAGAKFDQALIGFAVNWWGCNPDLQATVLYAAYFIFTRAGLHVDVENQAGSFPVETGFRH
jgi:hypothetical protein